MKIILLLVMLTGCASQNHCNTGLCRKYSRVAIDNAKPEYNCTSKNNGAGFKVTTCKRIHYGSI